MVVVMEEAVMEEVVVMEERGSDPSECAVVHVIVPVR